MITYSHRGYLKNENTFEAFINAFNKFDGIEFDVRLTKDKIPIVIHDNNLKRTHKTNKIIDLSNYNELKKYNIPLLIDVLLLVKKYNKKCLIDIKSNKDCKYIIDYLNKLLKNKVINTTLFKCIVYTDNIDDMNIDDMNILRAYKKNERININSRLNNIFNGLAIKFTGTKENMKYIDKIINKNLYINVYIYKIPNIQAVNYLIELLDNNKNNKNFSISTD